MVISKSSRAWPALALAALGLLSACGTPPAAHRPQTARSSWNRPTSYDPPGPASDPWGPWVAEAAHRFDVPERWIREVMRQESGGRVSATSPVGAMGLMQLMPGTFAELRGRYGLGDDPYHPYDNLMAGTAYLREMYDLYGTPGFLAAYNAGPRRLEDFLFNNRGLPAETRNYVARIGPRIDGHHPQRRVAQEIARATEIPHNIPAGPRRMDRTMVAQLREQRSAAQPGIQMAQLPAGTVIRMDPIPDGSTPEGAARLAGQDVPASYQVASAGGGVVAMAPIPDGSTREGAARLAAEAQREAHRTDLAPLEPLPLPPAQSQMAATTLTPPPGAQPQPRQMPRSTAGIFGVGGAHASTLPRNPQPMPSQGGGWSVQVGAFSSENLARTAAAQARDSVASIGSRATVQSVTQGGATLYRARVTGLSQSSAQQACDKLRSRGGCTVVAPGV